MHRRHSDAFLSSSGMEDLWDDIDDDVLVRMSQMVEERASTIDETRHDVDFTVLSDCGEDDWNSFDVDENRFNQMQTQFPETSKNVFKRPLSPVSGNSKKRKEEITDSSSSCTISVEAILEENKKLKSNNQKLNEEIYTKRGEVALLRADLRKKESCIEQERNERQKLLVLKNEELVKFREQVSKTSDAVKTDNEFLSHQLTQTEEKLKRMEMLMVSTTGSPNPCRRVPERRSRGFPEHDISTIVQDPKRVSPKKKSRLGKDVSIQAELPKINPYELRVHVRKGYLTSAQTVSLLGSEISLDVLDHNSLLLRNVSNPDIVKEASLSTADQLISSIRPNGNPECLLRKLKASRLILDASSIKGECLSSQSMDQLLKLISNQDVQKNILFEFLSLGEVLLRKQLLLQEHFKTLITPLQESLKSLSCPKLTAALLNFLSGSASNSEIAQSYCKQSNNSCFIFELCSLVTQTSSTSHKEELGLLMESYLKFLFSHTVSPDDLSWIGSLPSNKICNPCRMDILKTVSSLTVKIVQKVQELRSEDEMDSVLKFCLRQSISCLHKLWSTDPNFVQNLSDSPGSQREYIWATKELSKMESFLELGQDEVSMLADLSVQYDQR